MRETYEVLGKGSEPVPTASPNELLSRYQTALTLRAHAGERLDMARWVASRVVGHFPLLTYILGEEGAERALAQSEAFLDNAESAFEESTLEAGGIVTSTGASGLTAKL